MNTTRTTSYVEFVTWYLEREYSKRGKAIPALGSISEQMNTMDREHRGKLCSWFPSAGWTILELESEGELFSLVCLASDWTRQSGLLRDEASLDHRILRSFVRNATECNYFSDLTRPILHAENMEKRQRYISRLRVDPTIKFTGDNRIVLRSLSRGEKSSNPSGTYYLHDGLGRMLAYAYLISRRQLHFRPVEAFLAIEPRT
jgi:hypothetical protein